MSWAHVCGTLRARPWPKGTRSTGTEKVIRVLWYYAELADETSGEAYPSQLTVAEELGIHLRDVQNAQKALVEQGFLKRIREPKLGERGTTYRLASTLRSGYHEVTQSEFSLGTDPGVDEPEVVESDVEAFLSDPSRYDGHVSRDADSAQFGKSGPVQGNEKVHGAAYGESHGAEHGDPHGVPHGQNHGILHGYVPGTTEIQNNRRTEESADSAGSPKLPWWPALKSARELVNSLPERTFYELQKSPQQLVTLIHTELLENCTTSTAEEDLKDAAQRALRRLWHVSSPA